MLKLSDFFQPLNFATISYFFGLFIFFDILGTFAKEKILGVKNDQLSRILNWLIGFGIFVFIWFILSLFVTPGQDQILTSIVIIVLITSPSYFKNKKYKELFSSICENKIPFLIILPFLPTVFVKASLPPYYADEMAYHYIAPSVLKVLSPIKYTGGIYADLPRILDFFWQQIFTLFHTYSIARLFHFSILVTAIAYTYLVLKKNFGFFSAFLFVLIFFGLPQDIVLTSTLGYIDVGAYSFLLIGLVSAIDFLISKKTESLVISGLFWSLNLGTKYTGVSTFITFLIIFSIFVFLKRQDYSKSFSWKLLMKIMIVMLFWGGYWYIKNFIFYGNPIFPFIFPCWGSHVEVCPTTGSFFGDWTTKITLSNVQLILSQLLPKDVLLQIIVVIAPFLTIFSSKNKFRLISIFLAIAVLFELLLLKHFSGFYVRYHQHMQFYLIISAIIATSTKYKNIYINYISKGFVVILFISSFYLYLYAVRNTDSLRFLNWNEINYSIGKMNIYQWVDAYLPSMKDVVRWCEDPPKGVNALARFDPDLIWFDYDGYMRSFTTNCDYANPPLQGLPLANVLDAAKKQKMQFWMASENSCLPDSKVIAKHPTERPDMVYLRHLNNLIVCNSKEIVNNLYYFDYSKLK